MRRGGATDRWNPSDCGTLSPAKLLPEWRNGRRSALKMRRGNPCGFESRLRHQRPLFVIPIQAVSPTARGTVRTCPRVGRVRPQGVTPRRGLRAPTRALDVQRTVLHRNDAAPTAPGHLEERRISRGTSVAATAVYGRAFPFSCTSRRSPSRLSSRSFVPQDDQARSGPHQPSLCPKAHSLTLSTWRMTGGVALAVAPGHLVAAYRDPNRPIS